MIKKALAILGLFAALTMLVACGTTYYTVTTNVGKSYTAVNEPKLDTKAKTYHFKDTNGNEVILNQDEVTEIKSLTKQ
jgi:hypothetical protein